MPTHFAPAALKFLGDLARHNDRDWFNPRKPTFESTLKTPMLALIDELNHKLESFAPDHIRPPHKVMMRIYRDIRFSPNKAPYKTNIAAWWSREGIAKTTGAGFYLSLGLDGVTVAAGAYEPDKDQLLAIRNHLIEHHATLARLLNAKKFKTLLPTFHGNPLTRPPKGFPNLPPEAMEWVKCRQWAVSTLLPPETALAPTLLKEVVTRFQAAAPLVALLNEPLLAKPRKPIF